MLFVYNKRVVKLSLVLFE